MALQESIPALHAKQQYEAFLQGGGDKLKGERLRFAGVDGYDVYNPSIPFELEGRTVMAARVELRSKRLPGGYAGNTGSSGRI